MAGGTEGKDAELQLNATAASLLGFLAAGPQSGYTLAAHIERSIGNFWNVTRSQIYRELRTLEAAGYVRVGKTGTRDRRPYALTAAGRKAFDEWIARAPGDANIRMPILLTVFFGDRLPAETLSRILHAARERHAGRLAAYSGKLAKIEQERPFPAKTARFGTMYEEMVLAWFASLEADGLM
jgi:DNA-binding PadR family transcriptional regulator